MTETPYQQMAKQCVDMWQQQLALMLTKEEFINGLIDHMHQWHSAQGGFSYATAPNPAQAAAYAAVSPESANAVMDELRKRIATGQCRIEELERELEALRQHVSDDGGDAAGSGGTAKGGARGTGGAKPKAPDGD